MNELAARIADGWAPPLSDAERAAMETDREIGLHLSTRREPCDCELCLTVLPGLANKVRRYIAAATPFIEARVREEEREHFEAELRGQRIVAYHDGVLAGIAARDRELAEAGRLLPEDSAASESDKAGPND